MERAGDDMRGIGDMVRVTGQFGVNLFSGRIFPGKPALCP